MYKEHTRGGALDAADDHGLVGEERGDKVGTGMAPDGDEGVPMHKRVVDIDVESIQTPTYSGTWLCR